MPVDQKEPDFKGPPLSCDCHLHVFGDEQRYPLDAARRNSPPTDPLDKYLADYLALAGKLGIQRMVFVQPSTYGKDNSCLVDAMKVIGANSRAIVDIDENAPDAELARLSSAGVCGVRINAGPPNRPQESGLVDKLMPRIERLAARCTEINWQLDFLGPSWFYGEMMGTLKKLKCDFTIAHYGMYQVSKGLKQPGFQQMLDFLRHGDGHCYVKLTAPYRLASEPYFYDAALIGKALIEAAPDRIIWGSDYPYLSNAHRVNSIELFNVLGRCAPDPDTRKKILVDNPQRLFRF